MEPLAGLKAKMAARVGRKPKGPTPGRFPVPASCPCARETQEARRARLTLRRARQIARARGFVPMSNKRVQSAIATAATVVALEAAALRKAMNPAEIHDEAVRRVACKLPPPPVSKLYRYRPSRSDDAAYRHGNR